MQKNLSERQMQQKTKKEIKLNCTNDCLMKNNFGAD